MLVLTRKQRQQITIGGNITITVLRVKGSAVRIGIEAPDGVRILRAELNLEEGETVEAESVLSRAQQSTNNSRRSMSGETADAHPLRERTSMKQPQAASAAPLAGLRGVTPAVSLLSFR